MPPCPFKLPSRSIDWALGITIALICADISIIYFTNRAGL